MRSITENMNLHLLDIASIVNNNYHICKFRPGIGLLSVHGLQKKTVCFKPKALNAFIKKIEPFRLKYLKFWVKRQNVFSRNRADCRNIYISFVKEFELHGGVSVPYLKKNTNRRSILVHIFFYYIQLVYICIKGLLPVLCKRNTI